MSIFIIAELGINHSGSLDLAKAMIDMAVSCGVDAVKFQRRVISEIWTPKELAELRENPWGTTFGEQKEGLEFSMQQYREIDIYCKLRNIPWFASAWGEYALDDLRNLAPQYNKIASPMLTNEPFICECAKWKVPTFISTGMSTITDIHTVLDIFGAKNHYDTTLMHSVSIYPCPENKSRVGLIPKLREWFDRPVGYSGHTPGLASYEAAMTLGAVAIEAHITLDRSLYGSDQASSLEKPGLQRLVDYARVIEKILGNGEKTILPEEKETAKKLRYWER